MERAAIIFNPTSRTAPRRQRLEAAAAEMRTRGWEIVLSPTEGPNHATELAREAANGGARVVFACGGDGTVNEVVNGLVQTDAALGVLRAGMGNVYAKEVGVPRRLENALFAQLFGLERRFDLGIAGGRYFILMCGVGFDASVVQAVPAPQKRILGSTSYMIWGLKQAFTYHSRRTLLRLDSEEIDTDLFWLLLSNTRSYAGVLNIASDALADDGSLDAYYFTGDGLGWKAIVAARLALRQYRESESVVFRRLHEAEVLTAGLPVQVDGEYVGDTPMKFGVERQALRVRLAALKGQRLLQSF